jgi:protein glucosyltransferase
MIPKGYRLSFSHLFFYVSSFIIATQLWSIWRQSAGGYASYTPSDWLFETDVHANIHTLSHEQCDLAFPELYESLDKAVARKAGRKVHIQDIEIAEGRCMLRVMIYQGEVRANPTPLRWTCAYPKQLFVVNSGKPEECYVTNGNERERILGTLAQIDRAISTSPANDPSIPNIEFSLSLDDLPLRSKEKGTFFGYTRKDAPKYDDIWMMPNYVRQIMANIFRGRANKLQAYWSWNYTHAPSWNSIRREIDQTEQKTPWHKKDPRVVWRGKIKMAELRKELVRVSEGKRWSDIKPVVINNATDVHTKDVMNLRQFCGYVRSS